MTGKCARAPFFRNPPPRRSPSVACQLDTVGIASFAALAVVILASMICLALKRGKTPSAVTWV